MQINEELVKQITNAVLSQMSHAGSSSVSGGALPSSSSAVPSMAGTASTKKNQIIQVTPALRRGQTQRRS